MKKLIYSLMCFLFVSFALYGGENSWTLLGPWGGEIREIVVHPTDPNIIYVSNFTSGLYKTTDQGKTWVLLQDDVLHANGYDIELDPENPDIIYFSAYKGIFKSLDGGQTWQKTLSRYLALDVEINPFDHQMLIAAAQNLYQSIDYGTHWDNMGFGTVNTYTVEYDPNRPHVYFVGANFVEWYRKTSIVNYGICKTIDDGATFTPVNANMEDLAIPRDIQLVPNCPHKVYVVGVNERYFIEDDRFIPYRSIFCSNDSGETFHCINNGLQVNGVEKIFIHPENSDILYVCTKEKGLCKSINGGETWLPKNEGVHELISQTVALDKQNSILYLGTKGSIYKSMDHGDTWQEISYGMNGFGVHSLAQNPLNPNTMYVAGNYLPRKSLDGGKTWRRIGKDDLGLAYAVQIAIDPVDTNVVYAGFSSNSEEEPHGVWRSDDGGITWKEKNNELPYIPYIWDMKIVANDTSTTLVLGTTKGFFISYNRGVTWIQRNNGINKSTLDIEINTVAIDPQNQNTMYASGTQLYKTNDQGQNWHVIKPYAPSWYWEVYVHPHKSNVIFVSEDDGIFVSYNQGKDWQLFKDDGYMVSVSPVNPDLMFVTRNDLGSYGMAISYNGGQTWHAMDTGWYKPPAVLVRFDTSNPNKIYAGFHGLFCWTISPSGITENNLEEELENFSLSQNYPNPFNPETIIPFTVSHSTRVKLEIYNLLGQRIRILADRHIPAGLHSIRWDGRDALGNVVNSGVYFYSINAEGFQSGKKMILLR